MRSPVSAGVAAQALLGLLAVFATTVGRAVDVAVLPVARAAQPDALQIDRAFQQMREDPDLAQERKIRSLKWKTDMQRKPTATPEWLRWWLGLFRWIAGSARYLIWAAAAVLAAMLVVYILRLVRGRNSSVQAGGAFVAPTHVRDLDIRPESLPEDIGAAAFDLWNSGEQRRALALLYRGMLSRLVHGHAAPIRHSTTEGECLVLAQRFLRADGREYAARLVGTWQRAVYGGQNPAIDVVQALCQEFSLALGTAAPASGSST